MYNPEVDITRIRGRGGQLPPFKGEHPEQKDERLERA